MLLSVSIYPETLGFKETHWLVDPTGEAIPPVSLVNSNKIKWIPGGKLSLQVLLENLQVLLQSDIILFVLSCVVFGNILPVLDYFTLL